MAPSTKKAAASKAKAKPAAAKKAAPKPKAAAAKLHPAIAHALASRQYLSFQPERLRAHHRTARFDPNFRRDCGRPTQRM